MTTQINQLTELTNTSDGDLLLIREASTGVDKKMQASNLRAKATTKDDVGLGDVDNVSAASLRDRSTHTGTQTLSTISDAGNMALQNKESVNIDGGTIDGTAVNATTLTASGDVNFDSGTLFVDASTNRVGIRTTTANATLDVKPAGNAEVVDIRCRNANDFAFVRFRSHDGSENIGNISAQRTGADAGNIRMSGANECHFFTDSTERMRIDSSGNVGVGTTAPDSLFHLKSAEFTGITLQSDRTGDRNIGGLRFVDKNGEEQALIVATTIGNIDLKTNGSNDAMRIDSSGRVGIGTTAPGTRLDARASVTAGGAAVVDFHNTAASGGDGSPPLRIIKSMATTTSDARFVQFFASNLNTPMGGIVGNGASNVQFASISDKREKTNIVGISGSLEKIKSLKPVAFDWISNKEHCPAGFVAQDVEQVFPEFVIENLANEGQEPRKGLTGGMTGGIVAHLVKAIQELTAKVEQLEAQIGANNGN